MGGRAFAEIDHISSSPFSTSFRSGTLAMVIAMVHHMAHERLSIYFSFSLSSQNSFLQSTKLTFSWRALDRYFSVLHYIG